MKAKYKILQILSLVFIATITSCSPSSFEGKIVSEGVKDQYASEKEDADKVSLKYTYKDLINNFSYDIDSFPATGDAKFLVIPVWFKDSSTYLPSNREDVRNDIFKSFFGNESDTGWRSLAGYYKQESFNKLNISGIVAPWYECQYNASDVNSTSVTIKLVKEATTWYANSNSDYSDFDVDKNGYIDGVALIYAAPDHVTYERKGGKSKLSDNLWAYSYWVQETYVSGKPIPNTFMWASYDFMYDYFHPKYGSYGYGDCNHSYLDSHTYIHEMGHILGIEDYYDYASSSPKAYEAAGVFSMQDSNVGGHDPFSKMALGWTKPYVVTGTSTITIKPNQDSGDLIVVSPDFDGSPFDEFLLIELYSPTGLNYHDVAYAYLNQPVYQGPNAYGIRLWHVDSRLVERSYSRIRGYYYDESTVTNNPTKVVDIGFENAVSNTTKTSETEDYASPLSGYEDYRLLQLIRRNKSNYKATGTVSSSDLFKTGDAFNMLAYAGAFKNYGKLNKKTSLGYSILFTQVSSSEATISFTKL